MSSTTTTASTTSAPTTPELFPRVIPILLDNAERERKNMKLHRGSTGVIWPVYVYDSSSPRGLGLGTIGFGSMLGAYKRSSDSASLTLGLGTGTLGTYTSGAWIEIPGMTGWYEFHVPNACFAEGTSVAIQLYPPDPGIPVNLFAEIDGVDYQDDQSFGLRDMTRVIAKGVVGVGSTTSNVVIASVLPQMFGANQFKGRTIIFDDNVTIGPLRGQAAEILSSSLPGSLGVTTMTAAPASGDTFLIV